MVFKLNPLKLLPFCFFHKIVIRSRNNPQGILKFFKRWDYDDNPEYKTIIVDIREIFYGQYMFTTENYELERRRVCLKKELEKVEGKIKP